MMAHPRDQDKGLNIQDNDLDIHAIRTMAFGLWDLWSEFLSSPQYSSIRTRLSGDQFYAEGEQSFRQLVIQVI